MSAPISKTHLSGPQRAAVLIMFLGHEHSARILKELPPRELKAVSLAMAALENLSRETVAEVVAEFVRDLTEVSMVPYSGQDFVRKVLPDMVDPTMGAVVDAVQRRVNDDFEQFCSTQSTPMLAALVMKEGLQTQAVALALMGPDNAARVFQRLPKDTGAGIAKRMAQLDRIPGDLRDDVVEAFVRACDQQSEHFEVGGLDRTARVIGRLPKLQYEELFRRLGEDDKPLADNLRRRMVVFDDLTTLDVRGVQTLMKQIPRDDMISALSGANPIVVQTFLAGVSSRAADDIKEEMELRGRMSKKEIEAARARIVETALKLASDGQIFLEVGTTETEEGTS